MIRVEYPELQALGGDAAGALFSSCRVYRFALWRVWQPEDPHVLFVGLNPSSADESQDDPTLRRCVGFARRWGFGGVRVVNLFAVRAVEPAAMRRHPDPVGPSNDRVIQMLAEEAPQIVVAWGAAGTYLGRHRAVLHLLPSLVSCLGTTRDGHPRHPLYVRAATNPIPLL